MSEQVLVVPANTVSYTDIKDGWSNYLTADPKYFNGLLLHAFFMDRAKAEIDENFKQLIPYCVVQNNSGEILVYERSKKGGETRLHAKMSCGMGGHINPIDWESHDIYNECLKRELEEELNLKPYHYNSRLLGSIYDNTNDVGKVHWGICHLITPHIQDFSLDKFKFEDTIKNPRFMKIKEAQNYLPLFEGWSQIVLKNAGLT